MLRRGCHLTPANLSAPRLAIGLESSAWSAARKLTQNLPERWISGQAREVLAGMNSTSGGSSETLENDWQVMPTGSPPLIAVTTVTPGGEPAEHVAEPARRGDRLRVVGVDGDVLAGAELEVDLESPSQELISSGLGQVSRASWLIPSGISSLAPDVVMAPR